MVINWSSKNHKIYFLYLLIVIKKYSSCFSFICLIFMLWYIKINRVCPWNNLLNIKYLYFDCTMKKKMVETLKYCVKTVEYNSIFIAIGYLNSSGTRNSVTTKEKTLKHSYLEKTTCFSLYIQSRIVLKSIQMFRFNCTTIARAVSHLTKTKRYFFDSHT